MKKSLSDELCNSGDVTSKPMAVRRSGTQFITAIPSESGRAVSMLEFKGNILLACEFHIYELSQKKVFKKIKFEVKNGTEKA
jgi:hypothetical protein